MKMTIDTTHTKPDNRPSMREQVVHLTGWNRENGGAIRSAYGMSKLEVDVDWADAALDQQLRASQGPWQDFEAQAGGGS
jgi:hypothetical protein